ncbi:unnamed protein product [Dibothriocephalus latus]|uniref:RING-type domain-containing protein n=1 Tax=Dibothriocephalus latus TaxID=60516 RepID=A0A3P7LUG9_DIBLA|nr:unnamed protein product [Dibothriocephalus latus]
MKTEPSICDGCNQQTEEGKDLPCKHFLCTACVDPELKKAKPQCTKCKKEFTKEQAAPHSLICLDITCEGAPGCKKMHLTDIDLGEGSTEGAKASAKS